MIDLHCHVLAAIDDGAIDDDDSIAMAGIASGDGIDAICATPHIRHDHDVRICGLAERVRRLNLRLAQASIAVEILQGGEVAETALGSLDDAELREVSLARTGRWVLLEPAPGPLGDSLDRAVAELAERGAGAVIAHPERHPSAEFEQRLVRLVRMGALVQATAAAITDPRSGSWMLELAARGLLHVLGSDAHSSHHGRPPSLATAVDRLRDVEALRPHVDWIAREAPVAIVRGEPVEPPFATVPL